MKKYWFILVCLLIVVSACSPGEEAAEAEGEEEQEVEENDDNAEDLAEEENEAAEEEELTHPSYMAVEDTITYAARTAGSEKTNREYTYTRITDHLIEAEITDSLEGDLGKIYFYETNEGLYGLAAETLPEAEEEIKNLRDTELLLKYPVEDGMKWRTPYDGQIVEKEIEIKNEHIGAFHTFDELVWVTTRDRDGNELKSMSFALDYNLVGYSVMGEDGHIDNEMVFMFIGEEEVLEITTEPSSDGGSGASSDWLGEFVRESMHNRAVLTVSENGGADSFNFNLQALSGGNTGEIEGTAVRESDGKAVYKDNESTCQLTFHFSGGNIKVEQTEECSFYGGMGVIFDGEYSGEKEGGSSASYDTYLLDIGVFNTAEQNAEFAELTGDQYHWFAERMQFITEEDNIDGYTNAKVVRGYVRGLATIMEAIIICTDQGELWGAVLNDDVIYYYTNVAEESSELPATIHRWAGNLSYHEVRYESGGSGSGSGGGSSASGSGGNSGGSSSDGDSQDNEADLKRDIDRAVETYLVTLIEAINANNFSIVEPILTPDSSLYSDQVALVDRMEDLGITQALVNFRVVDYDLHVSPNQHIVTVEETIDIIQADGSNEVKDFKWLYTVNEQNGRLTLGKIERP